jgi:hypothetical protein
MKNAQPTTVIKQQFKFYKTGDYEKNLSLINSMLFEYGIEGPDII